MYLSKSEDFQCSVWPSALAIENYAKLSMGHRFGLCNLPLFLGLKEARLNCNYLKNRKASALAIIHMPNDLIKPNVKKSASVIPNTQASNVQYFWISPFIDKGCRTSSIMHRFLQDSILYRQNCNNLKNIKALVNPYAKCSN